MNVQIKQLCEHCGQAFEAWPSDERRFCSTQCYNLWRESELYKDAINRQTQICEYCGQEFKRPKLQKFCSRQCRDLSKRVKRILCTCKQCGKSFEETPGRVTAGRGVFCSRECKGQWASENYTGKESANWRGGKVTIRCNQCHQEFKARQHELATRRFCSRKCYEQWFSQNLRGDRHPLYKSVILQCEQCECEFERKPSAIEGNKHNFCCHECSAAWWSENRNGEKAPRWEGGPSLYICEVCRRQFEAAKCRERNGHKPRFCSSECYYTTVSGETAPRWLNGKSFEPYPSEFNEQFKGLIRERDKHTCAICRLYGKCVHHINYIKIDTASENCITLCRSCHNVTNGNREYWQSALSQLMMARQLGGKRYVTTS